MSSIYNCIIGGDLQTFYQYRCICTLKFIKAIFFEMACYCFISLFVQLVEGINIGELVSTTFKVIILV